MGTFVQRDVKVGDSASRPRRVVVALLLHQLSEYVLVGVMYPVRNPYVGPYVSIDAGGEGEGGPRLAARENQRRNYFFCMMSMD